MTDIYGDPAEEVKIFFVDHGRRRKVPVNKLCILPYKFASVVHQVGSIILMASLCFIVGFIVLLASLSYIRFDQSIN